MYTNEDALRDACYTFAMKHDLSLHISSKPYCFHIVIKNTEREMTVVVSHLEVMRSNFSP